MVEIGNRVYWVEFDKVRSGVIVKKSWLRKKVWIKTDDSDFVFEVPASSIEYRYFTTKEDAIKKIIEILKNELFFAEHECERIQGIKEAISYWKMKLKECDDRG